MRFKHRHIYNVMKWSAEVYNRPADFPRSLKDIYQLISSPSPVCSYVPPTKDVSKLLLKMLDLNVKSDSSLMKTLQLELPFFHRVLADLTIETCLPEEWKGLLLHLETCSNDPFIKSSKVQLSTDGLEVSTYSWYIDWIQFCMIYGFPFLILLFQV